MTDTPLDNKNFRWLSVQTITIGFSQVLAIRVSFTGELGYELHMPTPYVTTVYKHLVEAGKAYDMVHFGLLATESMRLEKCYRTWKGDLSS